jgi:hypothetical protein
MLCSKIHFGAVGFWRYVENDYLITGAATVDEVNLAGKLTPA